MRPVSLVCAAIVVAMLAIVQAHPTPFSNIRIDAADAGTEVLLVAYAFDFAAEMNLPSEAQAVEPDVVGERYEKLAAFALERIGLAVDGRPLTGAAARVSIATSATPGSGHAINVHLIYPPADGATLRITSRLFPYDPLHQTFVSVRRSGALVGEEILTRERPSAELSLDGRQPRWEVIGRFTRSGIEHIAIGPDHILFLIGLLLLGGTFWHLVRIVTAFTLAHSVTLSLAALDLVSLPPRLVESTIALSICVVAVTNLIRGVPDPEKPAGAARGEGVPASDGVRGSAGTKSPGSKNDYRTWMAFGFGLIHGFGFAHVLRELALPRAALGLSLFSFNLGVELGQLVIVLIVVALMAAVIRRGPILHRRIVLIGSLAVLWAGFFWLVQRLFFA